MKLNECDVIQDLLPSYSDKISSNATNKLVEEHLQECKKCRTILKDMNKEVDYEIIENQEEKINYLKGFKRRRKMLITVSIILTILILVFIFILNILNQNILIDRLIFVDVNKFNVEYMYLDESTENDNKLLKVYLYSDEYKDMYLTGGYEATTDDKEIYYKISAKRLPKGVEFDGSGLEMYFYINDNTEKIYIEDRKHNLKEIWNKDIKVQTEEEWRKWYIDSYVPEEIKQLYKMNYDNIPVGTSVWKHLYNANLKNGDNVKVWGIEE